jgi:aspartyl protease family protein
MLFVGVALLIAVGIALAISADAGAMVGLTQNEAARLIPLLLILTLIASGVFARRHRFGEIVTNFIIWGCIGAVLMVGYTYRNDLASIGNRVMGELQPGAAIVDPQSGNVRITRSFGGSFRVNAAINGSETPMIFDTGATAVVLSTPDARAAGIDTASLSYSIPVQTANGTGWAAAITLDNISIGNITRDRIRGFVVQDGALETSLLGMTFLETLSRYTVSQDALEMHD